MNALDDRLTRLQKAYPDAPLKALLRVPLSFDQDPVKIQASIRTWTVALELASMIEWRVAGLAKAYREPFPGVLGPDFRELAQGHSAAFLRRIEQAPAPGGSIPKELLYGAFDAELDQVRLLEGEIRPRNASQTEVGCHPRRSRSR